LVHVEDFEMSILLVEGHKHVREVITSILEGEGYDVLIATSENEALDLLRSERSIALALVDVAESTLDGRRLCEAVLASAEIAVPLVVMTGGIPPEDLPVRSRLRKPFGMNELLETVRTQMAAPRRHKKVREGSGTIESTPGEKRKIVG
jgi:CheY-like chemotaxis protein